MASATWDTADFTWDSVGFTWEEIDNIFNRNLGDVTKRNVQKLAKEDKKKLIRCIMYLNDNKVYDEEKEVKRITAYIDDIKMVAEEIKKNVQIIY